MSDRLFGMILILMILCAMIWLAKKTRELSEEEDGQDDFAFLTVREQIAAAKETSDALGEAEQLITDMQECTPDDVIIMRIEWVGHDDEEHGMELYCDGSNTAAECLAEIGEREAHELEQLLSRQCAILSGHKRSRQSCRQSYGFVRGEESDDVDEALRGMRRGDPC
jgi:hypothetical protein